MQDIIFLEDLKFSTKIGVLAWEKQIEQTITISLKIYTDFANLEDKLEKTVDYSIIYSKIKQYLDSQQHNLIETLAENIASLVLNDKKIAKLEVLLEKPSALPETRKLGVKIERSN